MGLDMYLYARREVTNAATQRAIAERLPLVKYYNDDDTDVYLSMWSHIDADEKALPLSIVESAGLIALMGPETNSGYAARDGSWVSVSAIYWRKANAIHAWFVDNCKGGIDDCQESGVHCEQLAQLMQLCDRAVALYEAGDTAGAADLMSPRSGFFFGSTDIDEWWARDLTDTANEIRRVINAAIAVGGITFTYQSSW